jgi:hypothetical protein
MQYHKGDINMEAIITSTEYKNGTRVTVQNITYTKSEDVRTLGNYYNQLSAILSRIETTNDASILETLVKDRENMEAKIQEQEEIVRNYPAED